VQRTFSAEVRCTCKIVLQLYSVLLLRARRIYSI
jgi:hypothetical protein